jgi:serine/threonine protein kinase
MSHLGSKSTSRIADIYSFCGNSIFSEFAEKGTVSDIIWPLNGSNCTISSTERLQLAFKIANAVSDAHNYDADGVATVAHTDITPSQFLVFQGGLIKLNDFNRCRFLKRDNGQICPYKVSHNPGKFRSPEEYSYGNQSEMVDIYSMGNVFYSILSEKWPFEDIDNTKVVQEKITNGERPLTKYFEKDKASVMLSEVIDLCWKQNPEERPSARDVALLLKRKIEKL